VTRQVIADALLTVAVLIVAASALGVLFMPGAAAKLHYVTPAAVVAPVFVAVAMLVQEGLDANTGETFLALFFMVVVGPFLSHATIRAIRVRERGDWRPRPARRDEPDESGKAPQKVKEKTP
jgi:multisubunit Na+/H+ antiporter MnhG subunit